jgi:hypothetical protein
MVPVVAVHAYQSGSTSPDINLPDSISVEQVKQWLTKALDWLAYAIVWVFKNLSAVIVTVVEFIAEVIVILIKAAIKFFTTIFKLLKSDA